MRLHFPLTLLFAFCLGGCHLPYAPASVPSRWILKHVEGRTVWRADSGPWRAEVEPARGRLVYLGLINGANLLNYPPGPPSDLEFGGHRVWLGPQKTWPVLWPPPAAWERKAARSARASGDGTLVMESARGDDRAPTLRRTYRWQREGHLLCGVSWFSSPDQPRQSIHILQLRPDAEVIARPDPSSLAPRGFVRLPLTHRPVSEYEFGSLPQIRLRGKKAALRLARDEEKLGFSAQAILARWPEAELRLFPGQIEGLAVGDPDQGFRSQVYLGGKAWPVLEIEQLSPVLKPRVPGGAMSHQIEIELRR